MRKNTEKIILTIIALLALIGITILGICFCYGLYTMDDDLMYICGFTLMAITSVTVLTLILSSWIASIWKKEK